MNQNVMIVGVGGQGSLLASKMLGHVVMQAGYDVKVSEVHGMSQRGGSVVTYVRYSDETVWSPVINEGEADIIISFELLEAARWIEYLKPTDYPVGKLDEFPLLDNTDVLVKEDIFRLLRESGVGVPAYYEEIPFEVDGKTGTYCRSRSGCYFCFFQQKIEWIWLYEQHPDLYRQAMEFEKDGYTWNQNESLADLIKPERIRQIKLDIIRRQEDNRQQQKGTTLVDILGDDIMCTNCFI